MVSINWSVLLHKKTNIFRYYSFVYGHSLGKSCTRLIKRTNCNELVSCLSCSRAGSKSEPILLSKFCLIMHSSLLPRPLQPCLYPPLILPSVRQQPAATHCSLCSLSHIASQLPLSVFLWATVSPSLFPCICLYLCFQTALTRWGESIAVWPCGVSARSLHRSVSVCVSVSKPTCYLMGISICCQITFSACLSRFVPLRTLPFHNAVGNCKMRMWRMSTVTGNSKNNVFSDKPESL